MNKILSLSLITAWMTAFPAWAELSPREVTVEWEQSEGSIGYEVIVRSTRNKKFVPKRFKVKETKWKGQLVPGIYELKFRSVDERGVVGDWSPAMEIPVQLKKAQLVSPIGGKEIPGTESSTEKVEMKWTAVEGAKEYQVLVYNSENKKVAEESTRDLNMRVEVPVAQPLTWEVVAVYDIKGVSSTAKREQFVVLGAPIVPPQVEVPTTKFVTQIEWAKSENAKTYDVVLERKNGNKWQRLEKREGIQETKIKVDPHYQGGQYRFTVTANAPLRKPSKKSSIEFKVYEGERTPAAIEFAKLREAIENDYNAFFTASYLISGIDYYSLKNERGETAAYNALGGTGRLGIGKFFGNSKWGVSGIADLGGIDFKSGNHTFFNSEAQMIYRTYINNVVQLRGYFGAFVRQLPESSTTSTGDAQVQNITFAGPQGGFQVWYPFSYKFGLQFNGQVLIGMLGLSTPDGGALSPSLSYQLGLMGSYKLSQKITGFAGVAYRQDEIAYAAKPFDGSDLSNLADDGDINRVALKGSYLNLYLEWGF